MIIENIKPVDLSKLDKIEEIVAKLQEIDTSKTEPETPVSE